jgi:hypothetical protein
MIRMTCECPTTGESLAAMAIDDWTAEQTGTLIAVHCPKCSKLHTFSRAEYVLELTPVPA